MKYCLILIALISCITGCNTVRGVGEDVEGGGKAIERAAG
jgi:predicted small secreted protein